MAGLREKQKAHRRQLMEQSAIDLFLEKGFDDTTIEEIADRAMVSPATVYNYYGTKGELLLALVARGEEGQDSRGDEFLARIGKDGVAELVTDVICSNIEGTLSVLSREVWGYVVAFVATNEDPAIAERYLKTISEGLGGTLQEVLSALMEAGQISEVDAHKFAVLLTRLERNHFLDYVYYKNRSFGELRQGILEDVGLLVKFIEV